MKTDPNATAFPAIYGQANGADGLTKREYFAGLALQGLLAGPAQHGPRKEWFDLPATAVELADDLLALLAK